MEKFTVVDVVQKGTGWFDISLEDGRTVSTKARKLADAAMLAKGQEVEGEINTKKSGNFTNHYLNALGDISDKPAAKTNGGGRKQSKRDIPPEAATPEIPVDDRNERIARQWAFGRAIEMYVADLSAQNLDDIEAIAEDLLQRSRPQG